MHRSPRPRRLRALVVTALSAALAVSLTGFTTSATAKPDASKHGGGGSVAVQLLSFNDFHGHLERDTPGEIGDTTAGGAEYLARHLENLRRGHGKSLTVAAGDLVGGSPFLSGLFHDEPAVESLNAMRLDVSGVGNHEFDEGVTELHRMQRGGCHPDDGCYFPKRPFEGADFQWTAANVTNDRTGRTALPPYAVRRVGSEKIAFIGMTLEGTDSLVAQSGIEGWSFQDEVRTANALVPEIRRRGIESIVVLLHEGGIQNGGYDACEGMSGPVVDIAERLSPAIDIVITGHTHEAYNCTIDDPAGQPRKVTSAAEFGKVVTETTFRIDRRTGDVVRPSVEARNHLVTQDVRPVRKQTRIIEKWNALAGEVGSRPVGETTAPITRAVTDGNEDRTKESDASNMIADAQLWATEGNGAQIAFMNPGGVRADFDAGTVTYAEAYTVQPFGNLLVTIPMTGAQIKTLLEQQCTSAREFQLGVSEGFTYTDARTHDGSTCTSIEVSELQLDGAPIVADQTYMVTVNSFLADGGDGFTVFNEIDESQRIGGGVDLDALIAYFGEFSPVAPPGTDRVTEVR